MPQFLVNDTDVQGQTAVLTGDEAHHAIRVLRVRTGDEIRIFNGKGSGYLSRVVGVSGKKVNLQIERPLPAKPFPAFQITLAQTMLPNETMDWLVLKATELGVHKIIPLFSERCEVKLTLEKRAQKQEHWQKVALTACKQCERLWLPEVTAPMTIDEAGAEAQSADLRLVGDLSPNAVDLGVKIEASLGKKSVWITVGPAGDWTGDELKAWRKWGFEGVALGADILRSETAAIYMVSVLKYLGTRKDS